MAVDGERDDVAKAEHKLSENMKENEVVSNIDPKVDEANVEAKNVDEKHENSLQLSHVNDNENAKEIEKSLPIIDGNEKSNAKEIEKGSISDENEKANANEIEKGSIYDENDKANAKETEKGSISDENEKPNAKEIEKDSICDENDKSNTEEIEKAEENEKEKKQKLSLPESDESVESANKNENDNILPSDLKENEKKALAEIRSLLEAAISANKLLKDVKKESKKDEANEQSNENIKENEKPDHDKSVTLWGIPLLPSIGDERTNVLLIKFLRAREFIADDAFEMLKNTLDWRKENKVDSILDEDFGNDYDSLFYMAGTGHEGNPICYNVYGVFADDELYNKTFGTEASRERFLRWRLQLMEKQIQKLDFRLRGTSTLVQINDLANAPGPSRRDIRVATKRAVGILQDNYPEFVAKNIFINVPFWYYAFNAILSAFLTQRTKSKFVFSRPAKVTETLLKYIPAEEIPVNYGGLRRVNDPEFSSEDTPYDLIVKAGATEVIEIAAPEACSTLVWDVTIIGWDVTYKEEFVPDDEGSYTLIVKKGRKIVWEEESMRNTFRNNEPGKIMITIENGIFKKKRVLYRYKTKAPSA